MRTNIFLYGSILSIFLFSCGPKGSEGSENGLETKNMVAKGGKKYGGTLRLSTNEKPQNLFPIAVTDVYSANLVGQIFEGLLKYNTKTLEILPAIAEKWEVDPSGKKFIFHLRKGVYFQDDACFVGGKGREVKAQDVKFTFDLACTYSKNNRTFDNTFNNLVKGASEHWANTQVGKGGDVTGVKIIDDYTISIETIRPAQNMLQIIALPNFGILPKEGVDKYGENCRVGAGAFRLTENPADTNGVALVRNPNYYGVDELGNKLPFLDTINIRVLPTKEQELSMFNEDKLDFVYSLPAEGIKKTIEDNIAAFNSTPPKIIVEQIEQLGVQYYFFNTAKAPFDNKKVRQAFNLAIDRNKICDNVLKGQVAGPGIYGITAPTLSRLDSNYQVSQFKGYTQNIAAAKKLLAEAGYPAGMGFPNAKILLNSGGAKHSNVALEIQKELRENLGINIDFEVVPYNQKVQDETYGRAEVFRDAWVPDYASPGAYLALFYGGNVPKDFTEPSYPNVGRFKNEEFDKWYMKGSNTMAKDSAYIYFAKAEKILIEEAPVMVLWYDSNYILMNNRVKGFPMNALIKYNFADVYIDAAAIADKAKDSTKK